MANDNNENNGQGDGGGAPAADVFVEVDGQKFVPDETDPSQPKLGENGEPVPYVEQKNERPAETPEAKRARLQRELSQHNKKHGFEEGEGEGKKGKKGAKEDGPKEFDLGEEAYLLANGVKTPEEMDLVKDFMQDTGRTLKEVLGNTRFQAELKEHQEAVRTGQAIPQGSRRQAQNSPNSVEFWIAKGELPPDDGTEAARKLRTAVVNAKQKAATSGSQFTSHPVVK